MVANSRASVSPPSVTIASRPKRSRVESRVDRDDESHPSANVLCARGPPGCTPIVNDGRKCPCCKAADTDIDPADPDVTRVWGRGIWLKNGKKQMDECWYCNRMFESHYRGKDAPKFPTKQLFLEALGKDLQLHDKAMKICKMLEEKCREMGGALVAKVRSNWNAAEMLVLLPHDDTMRSSFEDDDGRLAIPWPEYERLLKDASPEVVGKAMEKMEVDGKVYAVFEASGRKRMKAPHINDVIQRKRIADNQLTIGGDSDLTEMQRALYNSVQPSAAVHATARVPGGAPALPALPVAVPLTNAVPAVSTEDAENEEAAPATPSKKRRAPAREKKRCSCWSC